MRRSPVTGDAAEDDAGTSEPVSEPAADGGKACVPPAGVACDLITQCGCAADQHCQAIGTAHKPVCVAPGVLDPGSSCKRAADCPRGQTCDDAVCRSYCRRDADCRAGVCVAAHDGDPRSSGINVCWTKCQPKQADACGAGARCRTLQPERGPKGNYCAAPLDPCPTTEDGRCDDSRGTGDCVDGSDARDCGCRPRLQGASCDLIEQCGCPKGNACFPVTNSDATRSATCVPWTGKRLAGEPCQRIEDCAAGHVCGAGRSCERLCEDDAQCEHGKCLPVELSGGGDLKACYRSCDRSDAASCNAESRCARFDDRFRAQGDFCIAPIQPCFPSDGVCDEAKGSGVCAEHSDPIDCCEPSWPGAECNLTLQCGCAAKPGTSCALSMLPNGSSNATCAPAGATPLDHICARDRDCIAGAGCFGNVCRAFCSVDADCAGGGRCVSSPRSDLGMTLKNCLGPCDPASNVPCGPHTTCQPGAAASGCILVPLNADCPTNNGSCDEPEGTGLCVQGSDVADCS